MSRFDKAITGNTLINQQTGERKWFPQAQLRDAVQSGLWKGERGDPMLVVDDRGKTKTIDAADAGVAFGRHIGMAPESLAHVRHREEQAGLEAEYGDGFWSTGQALLEGTARGVTFGLSDVVLEAMGVDEEGLRERKRWNPYAATVGEIGGFVSTVVATGGASMFARGGAAAAKAGMASKVAGLTPAGLAFRGSMGAGRAVVPVGEAIAGGTLRGAGASTGLRAVGGKAIPWTVQGTIEGAAYGAGQGISTLSLSGDPMTSEALWSEMKAGAWSGAKWGAAFGGGLSILGDAHGAFRNWRESRGVPGAGEMDAIIKDQSEAWVGKEVAKTRARTEKAGLRRAEREVAAEERNYEKIVANKDKEVRKAEKGVQDTLGKQVDALETRGKEVRAKEAAVLKADEAVKKAQRAEQKSETRLSKAANASIVRQRKKVLKEAKRKAKVAVREQRTAEGMFNRQLAIFDGEFQQLLYKPSNFNNNLFALFQNGTKWRSEGYKIRENLPVNVGMGGHKFWDPMTQNLSKTTTDLDNAWNTFRNTFIHHLEMGRLYKRERDVGKIYEKMKPSPPKFTEVQILKLAKEQPEVYEELVKRADHMMDAVRAQVAEVRRLKPLLAERGILGKSKLPDGIDDIMGSQFSPGDYLRAQRSGVDLADGFSGMELLGALEVAGDITGTMPGLGEAAGAISPTLGAIIEPLLWFKGAKAGAKFLRAKGVLKKKPAVRAKRRPIGDEVAENEEVKAAQGAVDEASKMGANEKMDEMIRGIRYASEVPPAKLEFARVAQKELDQARQSLKDQPELGKEIVEEAQAKLRTAEAEMDALIVDTTKLDEAKRLRDALKEQVTEAEATRIAKEFDYRFGGGTGAPGKKGGKGRKGLIQDALESGLSTGGYYAGMQAAGGGNFRRAVAGRFGAGIIRRGYDRIKGIGGGGLGTSVTTAYGKTQSRMADGVQGFLGLSKKVQPYAAVGILSVLDNMSFGDIDFKGTKYAE